MTGQVSSDLVIHCNSYLVDEIVAVLADLVKYLVGGGAPRRVLGLGRHREAKLSGPRGFCVENCMLVERYFRF